MSRLQRLHRTHVGVAAATVVVLVMAVAALRALPAVVIVARGGLPAHVAGMFEEPIAFQRMASGHYVVFDRRAHAVYRIDAAGGEPTKIIDIGPEDGRVLGPTAVDTANEFIIVADGPNLVERIQWFNEQGQRMGGFTLPGRASPRVTLGTLVLSGIGSLQFTGRTVLINQPETGALITEYRLNGRAVRTFGSLRSTGQESDRDVHLALNVGLPLVNPRGGFYFVFQTGEPRFQKYAADGTLEFERAVQGRELDRFVGAQPTTWPRRAVGREVLPLVPPVVRAAAVDAGGRLWISFVVPYTYVYDEDGDRVRTVQFKAAGIVSPTSLFFAGPGRLLVTPGLYEFAVD